MRLPRRRFFWLALAALVAASAWSFTAFWRVATTEPPPAPPAVDAIVVLTGGGERISVGLDLLAAGRADRLYISGVNEKVDAVDILASRPDFPAALAGRVEIGRATNTAENAAETARWAAGAGVAKALLVTAYYHMPRSRILFRERLPGVELWLHPVDPPAASRNGWWRSLRGVSVVLVEWVKYMATIWGLRQ